MTDEQESGLKGSQPLVSQEELWRRVATLEALLNNVGGEIPAETLADWKRKAVAWDTLVDRDLQAAVQEDAQKWRDYQSDKAYFVDNASVTMIFKNAKEYDAVVARAKKELDGLKEIVDCANKFEEDRKGKWRPVDFHAYSVQCKQRHSAREQTENLCRVMGWPEAEWVKQ